MGNAAQASIRPADEEMTDQIEAAVDENADVAEAAASADTASRGLEALIDRKSFYRLIELGTHERLDGQDWFGLWSQGRFFPIIPSAELA